MFFTEFLHYLGMYIIETLPMLMIGFLISGIIREMIPTNWVEQYLGRNGIAPIFYATIIGTIAPVCCWGSLPIAVSFHKKGARLGPIFAFLVATPATSVSALLIAWRFLGLGTMVYLFGVVILMGLISGLAGNAIKSSTVHQHAAFEHATDDEDCACQLCHTKKTAALRLRNIAVYAFITMPKEIGREIAIGLLLAALVSAYAPIGMLVQQFLTGIGAYCVAWIAGLGIYVCATMSVPLVHALIEQGMNPGAALAFLILGPIASFGTILVVRKEFGVRILLFFLGLISTLSLLAGYVYGRL